jgi:hypothetical protein
MTVMADEATVRQFLEIISKHAVELARGNGRPGVLQLCCLSPHNGKMIRTASGSTTSKGWSRRRSAPPTPA